MREKEKEKIKNFTFQNNNNNTLNKNYYNLNNIITREQEREKFFSCNAATFNILIYSSISIR